MQWAMHAALKHTSHVFSATRSQLVANIWSTSAVRLYSNLHFMIASHQPDPFGINDGIHGKFQNEGWAGEKQDRGQQEPAHLAC